MHPIPPWDKDLATSSAKGVSLVPTNEKHVAPSLLVTIKCKLSTAILAHCRHNCSTQARKHTYCASTCRGTFCNSSRTDGRTACQQAIRQKYDTFPLIDGETRGNYYLLVYSRPCSLQRGRDRCSVLASTHETRWQQLKMSGNCP